MAIQQYWIYELTAEINAYWRVEITPGNGGSLGSWVDEERS
jgi:hypothetical protein